MSSKVASLAGRQYGRLFVGFVLAWFVLDRTAAGTNSMFGEGGLVVAAATLSSLLLAEIVLFREPPRNLARVLGLTIPTAGGLAIAGALSLALLLFYPGFARLTGTELGLRAGWLSMLPGLFLQAGVAEETLFRGYLFGHLRRTRTFWRAALLSMPPFLLVHVVMFTYMDAAVAAAASLLAVSLSFPLARLYDLGGRTIWAPAIVHFVVQGSVKIVTGPEDRQMTLSIAWMALCLVAPWLVFLLPRRSEPRV